MPLVINSLGGRHTHTQGHRHHGQKQFQETRCAPAKGRRMPGFKSLHMYILFIIIVHMSLPRYVYHIHFKFIWWQHKTDELLVALDLHTWYI